MEANNNSQHSAVSTQQPQQQSSATAVSDGSAAGNHAGEHVLQHDVRDNQRKKEGPGFKKLVDLAKCRPKLNGRSFVWTERLFVVDSEMQPVCTFCRVRVSVGKGTASRNTTNLIHHYRSPAAGRGHTMRLEEAMRRHEERGGVLAGPIDPLLRARPSPETGNRLPPVDVYRPKLPSFSGCTPSTGDASNAGAAAPTRPQPPQEAQPKKASGNPKEVVDLATCRPKMSGRSLVWTEGLFVLDSQKQPVCTCCRLRVLVGGGSMSSNTSNLIQHYKSSKAGDEHAVKFAEALRRYGEKFGKIAGVSPSSGSRVRRAPDTAGSAPFRSALAERVAEDLLDWMIMARLNVQDPAHALLRRAFRSATGDAGFELGTREQFRKALLKKRAVVAEGLKNRLEGTRPAITVETWTSSSAVPYVAMSVHYMAVSGSKWVLKRGACACEAVDGSPTPSRIGAKVMSMMKGLGIEDRVISVTSGSSPGLSSAIEKHTSRSFESIGCASSKIERAVRAYVRDPGVARTIDVFQRAAAHLHHCSQTREDFEAAQRARSKDRPPKKMPIGSSKRWGSWWEIISVALEHKRNLASAIEAANNRLGGPDIVITDEDWKNAAKVERALAPFHEAAQALEGDSITAPLLPCMMGVLRAHVEAEGAAFAGGDSSAGAPGENTDDGGEERWDEVPRTIKIAAALSARTKGLDWLEGDERVHWRDLVLEECRELFQGDMAREREASQASAAGETVRAPQQEEKSGEPARKRRKGWVSKCIQTQKAAPEGDSQEEEEEFSLKRRIEVAKGELSRFLAATGLDDEDSGDAELDWWSRHQHSFPTLARVAAAYLPIPASLPASGRVLPVTDGCSTRGEEQSGDDDTFDALAFLRGSHGLAWSSEPSDAEFARPPKGRPRSV